MSEMFDTTYDWAAGYRPRNHGRVWSTDDRMRLRVLYSSGGTLMDMCKAMARTDVAVLGNLVAMGLLEKAEFGRYRHVDQDGKARGISNCHIQGMNAHHPELVAVSQDLTEMCKQPKEPIMNYTPSLVTKQFIGTREADSVSDQEIFSLIQLKEARVKELQAIAFQPAALKAEVQRLQAECVALVIYSDNRKV